jgi:hypothetical protein
MSFLGGAPRAQTATPEFQRWFGNSVVVDESGHPLIVYHGTTATFDRFDDRQVVAGFHFGSAAQANMRVAGQEGRRIMPVFLSIQKPRRSKDAGGKWASKIKSAKLSGYDGIVYLNRYEGIPAQAFQRAAEQLAKKNGGMADYSRLDRLSDDDFRKLVPEAADSFIAFYSTQIKSAIGNRGTFDPNDPNILHGWRRR